MKTKKLFKCLFSTFILVVMTVTLLSGCYGSKHHIDYGENYFQNAKEEYRAGATVKLEYCSSDGRSCRFYVDETEAEAESTGDNTYIVRFKMPDRDVKISVVKSDFGKVAILQFHSFDGGGADYEAIIEDSSVVTYDYSKEYGKKNHKELSGAGYDVYFTLRGLKPGTTTVTIQERSPIADNLDNIYDVTVNDDLEISLKLRETIEIN